MKIILFGLAVLSGLLYSEIKDFILNGGFEHKLALTLLKLFTIAISMLILCIFESKIYKLLWPGNIEDDQLNLNVYTPPEAKTFKIIERDSRSRTPVSRLALTSRSRSRTLRKHDYEVQTD
jgi:hypothetical protein